MKDCRNPHSIHSEVHEILVRLIQNALNALPQKSRVVVIGDDDTDGGSHIFNGNENENDFFNRRFH